MTPDFSQLRGTRGECPSDATLEEFGFDALPEDEARVVRTHLKTCATCSGEVALIRQGFDAFPQLDERRALARIHTETEVATPWWRKIGLLLVPIALGGAAAIVFMLRPPPDPAATATNAVRAKGTIKLRVFTKTGEGAATELLSGQPVAPGSRLRFMVELDAPGHVRIFGVEASGAQYTAWPMDAAKGAEPLPAGAQRLPGAAQLDDSTDAETLHLVWCADAAPKCTVDTAGAPLKCPEGCAQTAFTLEKARP